MGGIAAGLQACRKRIADACAEAGRAADSVRLLAVSKTFPAEAIRAAHAAGQTAFGESYVQEALGKQALLADLALEWHFVGHPQGNKARALAEHFAWVHGVDGMRIAERLARLRPPALPALNVCIEVNVGGEASKHGVAPTAALPLARAVAGMEGLRLRGFMCIARPSAEIGAQRRQFAELRRLLDAGKAEGLGLDTLSMGMSGDMEAAILEGATLVRIGTAIFGRRDMGGPRPANERGDI